MNFSDIISLLELTEIQSPEDVRRAFRRLAKTYHPDKNIRSEDEFKKLLTAYDFALLHFKDLKNFHIQNQRKKHTEKQLKEAGDIFAGMFGFSDSGRILGYFEPDKVAIPFDVYLCGGVARCAVTVWSICHCCVGKGFQSGQVRLCNHCFGKGSIGEADRLIPCQKCEARGQIMDYPCKICSGKGRTSQQAKVALDFGAGVIPHRIMTQTLNENSVKDAKIKFSADSVVFLKPIPQAQKSGFYIKEGVLWGRFYQIQNQRHKKLLHPQIQTPFGAIKLNLPAQAQSGDVITLSGLGLLKNEEGLRGEMKILILESPLRWWQKISAKLNNMMS